MDISKGQKIFDLLSELNTILHKSLQDYYSKWSLTTSQILVLSLLDKHNEMKISDIALETGFPDSNISGIVDRLEANGFVERVRCTKDRRIVRVQLAEKAFVLKKDFNLNIEEYFYSLTNMTSDKDLDEIVHSLEKLKLLVFKSQAGRELT